MNRLLMALFLLGVVLPSVANEDICISEKAEREMYQCYQKALKNTQTELERAFGNLIVRYQKDDSFGAIEANSYASLLLKSQELWEQYRDSTCDFETYESRTGTGFSTIYSACLLEKTQIRLRYLNWYITNP